MQSAQLRRDKDNTTISSLNVAVRFCLTVLPSAALIQLGKNGGVNGVHAAPWVYRETTRRIRTNSNPALVI